MIRVRNFRTSCTYRTNTIIIGIISVIFSMCFFIAIMVKIPNPLPSKRVERNIRIAALVLAAFSLITSLLLIPAAKNEKKKLLIPWILITSINFILAIIYVVYKMTVIGSDPKGLEILAIIFVLIGIVVSPYILMVVCNYYKDLKAKEMEEIARRDAEQSPSS